MLVRFYTYIRDIYYSANTFYDDIKRAILNEIRRKSEEKAEESTKKGSSVVPR